MVLNESQRRTGRVMRHWIRTSAWRVAVLMLGVLVLSGALLTSGIASAAQAQSPAAITSDKPDYHPGEIVTLTGSGWKTGELVTIVMSVNPITHGDVTLTAIADASGSFKNSDYLVQRSDLGVTFHVQATGASGDSAQLLTFTDSISAPTSIGTGTRSSAGTVSTFATAVTAAVPVGNTIIVSAVVNAASGVTISMSDSGSNTYTKDVDITNASGPTRTLIFSAPVTTALTTSSTITISFTTAEKDIFVSAFQVSGLVAASRVDQTKTNTGTNTTALTTGAMTTTTQANDLLFAAFGVDFNTGSNPTMTAGSGYTALTTAQTSGIWGIFPEYQIVSATGAYTATGTQSSTQLDWSAALVAYKALPATKLAFTTTAFSTIAGVCSPQITVQSQDTNSNPANPASTETIALSTSGTGGTFYSNNTCTTVITSVSIANTANSASFFWADTTAGSPVITASGTGAFTSAPTQTETVTVNPTPAITTLSPASAPAGAAAQTLTINGSNFLLTSTVTYNGVAHTPTFVSAAQLTIPLTAADQATAGTFPVVVTNPAPGGGASNTVNFSVVNAVPTISSISPTSATAGAATQTLTINGTNYSAASTVTYNGVAHAATFVTNIKLTIQLSTADQATAGIFPVVVSNPSPGGASNSVNFTVNNAVPTITTLSPASATAGAAAQTLTINGTNFLTTSTVTYNAVAHTPTFVSATQLTIPLTTADQATAGTFPVVVTNPTPGGGASNSVNFTVNNLVPTITTLSPSSATAGAAAQTLTINGTNFLATSTVTYNAVAHTATFVNAGQLTIQLSVADQAAAGNFPVVVTNPTPGGGPSNAVNFTLNAPVPTITTLSPSSANAGASAQTLTINGTNFIANSTVTYNAVAHTATFVSATQLTIPLTAADQATAGTFPVVVTNPAPGGGASNSVNFTVNNLVPAITTLSPTSAVVGAASQVLTINGTNFVSASTATYNGVAHTLTFTNSTQVKITLTTGDQATVGSFPVVVTNPTPGGGDSNTVNFAVNNPVPTITTLSPSSASTGAAAQTLTINGTNFLTNSTATYNGVAHTVTFVSATQLTIPLTTGDQATAGTFAVVVTNPTPGGGASNSVNFTVNNLVPTITTLSPSSATAGSAAQTLTINGTNFLSNSTATYNGTAHTVTFVSATQLTIPLTTGDQATAGNFAVVVTNPAPGGGASNSVNFTVNNLVPTITTLSPASANVGAASQTLTINGTNFLAGSTATYNGVAHTLTFTSSTVVKITLTTGDQATAGNFPVVVTNPAPGGGASNAVNFVVNNLVPTITTLSPASASAGAAAQTLTINGTNFVAASTATYNGVAHTLTFTSSTVVKITLTTGDQATNGNYPVVVTNPTPGGGASNSVNFIVGQAPAITSVNNATFIAGTPGSFQVTATGSPAPTFAVTAGTLPSGLTMTTAGLISGTAAGGQTQVITITASNGITPNATQSFTVQVNEAPFINNTTTSVTYAVGAPASFQFTLLFGTPSTATWTETGALPAGLTLSTSGLLSGTPTQVGNFAIIVQADNGVPPAATENFTITVGKGATYTQPFNTGHGWTYTQLACTQSLGSCSSNPVDTTAGDCNPAPCVTTQATSFVSAALTGYFHNTYTWAQLGVPSQAIVVSVDGSFWDKASGCASGATAGMDIYDSTNTTSVIGATLEGPFAVSADTGGATHGNAGAKAVAVAYQSANTTVTLRFNVGPASGVFATCNLSGDNYNLTISYIPLNQHQVIVASVILDRYGRVLSSIPLIPGAKSTRSTQAIE
jgi:hypothetical protein